MADYETCEKQRPDTPDVVYRLGVAEYLRANFGRAANCLSRSLALEQSGEMRVAALYWRTLAACRGRLSETLAETIAFFDPAIDAGHHHAYKRVMELFSGRCALETVTTEAEETDRDLDYAMLMHGAAVYAMRTGDAALPGASTKKRSCATAFGPVSAISRRKRLPPYAPFAKAILRTPFEQRARLNRITFRLFATFWPPE